MKTKKTLNFQVRSLSGKADLQCTVDQLIMAGWVGRNHEALQAHIDELAELGIPGPKNVPEFYPLSVGRLSQGTLPAAGSLRSCKRTNQVSEYPLFHTLH